MTNPVEPIRTFKTAWFTKAARKGRITDDELCEAIEEASGVRLTIWAAAYIRSA